MELGPVAHEDHRGGIADPLHGGSLRGPVTCPVWTPTEVRTRGAGFPSVERVPLRARPGAAARRARPTSRARRSTPRAGARSRPTTWSRDARGAGARAALELLGPVVNATGVLLHTNLGRAPLGAAALEAMTRPAATRTSSTGSHEGVRGSRHEHAGALLGARVRRGSGDRRQQQRGRGAARARDAGARPVGAGVARRARRDRRRLPGSRDPRRDRRAGSSRSAPRTAPACADYERARSRRRRARAQGARVELPHGRLRRVDLGRRARRRSGRRWSSTRARACSTRRRRGCATARRGCATSRACGSASTRARRSSRSRATSCSADRRPGSSSAARDARRPTARRHPLARALRADKLTLAGAAGGRARVPVGRRDVDPALAHGVRRPSTRCARVPRRSPRRCPARRSSTPRRSRAAARCRVSPSRRAVSPSSRRRSTSSRRGCARRGSSRASRTTGSCATCAPSIRPTTHASRPRCALHDPAMRVVATAGHVDHGKSSLVLALTGTDPDRFPEEKARGLTIDLGFAFCTLPSRPGRRLRRRPRPRALRQEHARRGRRGRRRGARRRRQRGLDAADRGARADPRPARRPPRHGRAHEGRPRRRRHPRAPRSSRSPTASAGPWSSSTRCSGRGLDDVRATLDDGASQRAGAARRRATAAVGRPGVRGQGRGNGRDRDAHRRGRSRATTRSSIEPGGRRGRASAASSRTTSSSTVWRRAAGSRSNLAGVDHTDVAAGRRGRVRRISGRSSTPSTSRCASFPGGRFRDGAPCTRTSARANSSRGCGSSTTTAASAGCDFRHHCRSRPATGSCCVRRARRRRSRARRCSTSRPARRTR